MNYRIDAGAPPARVLIVEDERADRHLLEVMLGPEGFVLLAAATGEEALAITARDHPDIILLDVMMPGMDGYQVVAKLKSNPETTNIPVIIVTALDDRSARIQGLNAGAEDYLTKPVDRVELNVRVRNLLRLKSYSDYHRKHSRILEGQVSVRTAQLVESEARYRQIVESTSDGIVKVDLSASIVFANRRFADMFGYEMSELLGKSAFSLMDAEAEVLARDALKSPRQGGSETYELNCRRKDGAALAVSLACTPILDDGGGYLGVLGSARDVTEQKKLMAQLTVSDRMASIGTLAAGVAHEINNPLACVMANLDLAASSLSEWGQDRAQSGDLGAVQAELADAREATQRIRGIVRDLKIFSRSEEDETGPVDLQGVLESTLRMAWTEIRHRACLVKKFGQTPRVQASEARLGQVFLNLVVNAAQAMAEGSAESNEIRISTFMEPAGRVIVEIADTGPGMSREVLSRLFTPFFTTKPIGVGTGLGLSICQRIISSFGGSIEVTSEVGKGTAFRVALLPADHAVSEPVLEVVPDVTAVRRGRVLVIDDEPMIGKAIERTLFDEHEVVALASAGEALKLIGSGERFDLILCDLMMPQMTGMELHAGLARVSLEEAAKMIFLTGGAFTPGARSFLDTTSNQWIEKPFDIRKLRSIINERIR